jgi:hypothetical protein
MAFSVSGDKWVLRFRSRCRRVHTYSEEKITRIYKETIEKSGDKDNKYRRKRRGEIELVGSCWRTSTPEMAVGTWIDASH